MEGVILNWFSFVNWFTSDLVTSCDTVRRGTPPSRWDAPTICTVICFICFRFSLAMRFIRSLVLCDSHAIWFFLLLWYTCPLFLTHMVHLRSFSLVILFTLDLVLLSNAVRLVSGSSNPVVGSDDQSLMMITFLSSVLHGR